MVDAIHSCCKIAVTETVEVPPESEIIVMGWPLDRSNRKAMNRNWSNQKANPALKTKAGNK